jgi:hypothetical protein
MAKAKELLLLCFHASNEGRDVHHLQMIEAGWSKQ